MENIKVLLKYRNYRAAIELDNKITVIVGSSATGKSTLHRLLIVKDKSKIIDISNKDYKIIHLSNLEVLNRYIIKDRLAENIIYIIDECDIQIDDEVAKLIQNTINSYFIITSRKLFGKLNYSLDDIKQLITTNGVIRLENFIDLKRQIKD